MAGNRTSDNHTPAVPTLLELCCRTVDSLTIINLDNALDVLHFGRSHSIPALIQRGEAFIVNSFSGLTTKHSSDTLATVIGEPSYSRLRREAEELAEQTAKLRQLGVVVEPPPPPPLPPLPQQQPLQRASSAPPVPPPAVPPRAAMSAAERARRRFSRAASASTEKCETCQKSVYPAERLAPVEGRVWHKQCFRWRIQRPRWHAPDMNSDVSETRPAGATSAAASSPSPRSCSPRTTGRRSAGRTPRSAAPPPAGRTAAGAAGARASPCR